jgi:ABC-2 type transport system permease protein
MRSFFTLWRREFAALFLSPIAYVVLMFFLLVTGCGFYWLVKENRELINSAQGLFIAIWFCMLIVIPILTMRAFAEERKSGTFETLMTAPVPDNTVTLAKFAGALSFFVVMCAPTQLYVPIIYWIAPDTMALLDLRVMLGGCLMVILIASTFIALGLLASALTSNQIIAAMITFSIMAIVFIGGLFVPHLSQNPQIQVIGEYVSSAQHLTEASSGLFDSRSLVLYLSTTIFLLFATTKAISARR